jgi:hypothetical protein
MDYEDNSPLFLNPYELCKSLHAIPKALIRDWKVV